MILSSVHLAGSANGIEDALSCNQLLSPTTHRPVPVHPTRLHTTKGFSWASPDTAMLFVPSHLPPPAPPFLLMQNQTIARYAIMKLKVS